MNADSQSSKFAGTSGGSAYLCRMLAFTLKSRRPGNICGEGACINRKRRTKPAEESGSMWLLAW